MEAHPKTKKLVTVSNVFSMSSCALSGDGITSVLVVSPNVLDTPEPGEVVSGGGTLPTHTPCFFISRGTEPGANMRHVPLF